MKGARWERSAWELSQEPKRDGEEREHWREPEKCLKEVGKR